MNITVICIGKLKEKYWTDAIAEYSKRLSRYCRLSIIELKEERLPDNASPAEEEHVKTADLPILQTQCRYVVVELHTL